MEFSPEELSEARRRIRAFEIANTFIPRALEQETYQ